MNLAALFDVHDPTTTAIISRGRATTFGELATQTAALRGGLVGLGLEPGDRVAIVAANNWYFVATYAAVVGAGLVAVPLNPQSPAPEITAQLEAVSPRALVLGPTGSQLAEQLDRGVAGIEHWLGWGFLPEGGIAAEDLLTADPRPVVDRHDDDVAVLIFTAGTAGSPKAAMLSHGNLRANLSQMAALPGAAPEPGDVSFGVLPMFHIFGLNTVLNGALAMGSAVLLVERFDPASAVESIGLHGVTVLLGPPNMWAAFAGLPGTTAEAFASVRLAVSGAAKLPDAVARAVQERFGFRLFEGYGLTEASPLVTASLEPDAPIGSIGVPIPGVELRLVDDSGEDALLGDPGELWVRGPNVFVGYWDNPEATATAINSNGWLLTGDIAVVDDRGFLYLVDRRKELIIVSGFNVYPAEVEEVLNQHPDVEACAVVGVPHPYTGEAVKAYVQLRPGSSAEEDLLVDFCAERLARYKTPNKVWFVDELPRGLGGKLLRRELRGAES